MVSAMRKSLILVPLLMCASPAFAQPLPAPQLPPEITDPATAQRIADAGQAVSDAVLDMRIGGVKAAIEGRPASPRERDLTVREMARRHDPDFDRKLHQRMADIGPAMQRSLDAINQALPAMSQALAQAQQAIERAAANLPDPTYPRR
jgi:hypothetical protein